MGNSLALAFLLASSYYDIKSRSINPVVFYIALVTLFWWSMAVNQPINILYAVVGWLVSYAVAQGLSKYGIEFVGGDGKVVAIICGFSGLFLGLGCLFLALLAYRASEYPIRVPFCCYILNSFMVILCFKQNI